MPSVPRSADGPPAQVVDWNDAQRRSRRVVTWGLRTRTVQRRVGIGAGDQFGHGRTRQPGQRPQRGLPAVPAAWLRFRRFGGGVFPVRRQLTCGVRGTGRAPSDPQRLSAAGQVPLSERNWPAGRTAQPHEAACSKPFGPSRRSSADRAVGPERSTAGGDASATKAAVPRAAWGRAGPDVACSPCRAPPRSSVRGCRCPRRSRPLSSAVAPSASTTPRLARLLSRWQIARAGAASSLRWTAKRLPRGSSPLAIATRMSTSPSKLTSREATTSLDSPTRGTIGSSCGASRLTPICPRWESWARRAAITPALGLQSAGGPAIDGCKDQYMSPPKRPLSAI